ncbi:hypothetical protein QBC34DRAFT_379527 [Podospora aff. communis PSN243]|uniref:WD-like domain-containing protein n=1 Tax=Podospora aff. communis PSN243 TaxID=3040156 RepID=A0AAV9GPR6_9PEZI|nr:hypothetical protein QBC34DRAFT_379527 [Podospora aff. communis PSN243]
MKSVTAILAIAAASTTVPGAAVAPAAGANVITDAAHNMTLVLDVDDTGKIPVWRLVLDETTALRQRSELETESSEFASVASAPALNRRADPPQCSRNHAARADDCKMLYKNIQWSEAAVPNSPRHIVYGRCYISWSKAFSGQLRAFYWPAYNTVETCTWWADYWAVSGLVKNAQGQGVTQCLSGRASNCS